MPKSYHSLSTLNLKAGVTYARPVEPPEVVHWDDPAAQAMIDYKYVKADTIGPEESVDTALLAVKNSTYHVLLVVNKDQHILGLISAEDLLGEKPLKVIQERRLARADMVVRMVMKGQSEIMVLDIEQLRHAKVGNIIQTLRTHKQHYALVVKIDEKNNAHHTIRGIFSAAHISKQLGQDITSVSFEAQSIAELQHDLHLPD